MLQSILILNLAGYCHPPQQNEAARGLQPDCTLLFVWHFAAQQPVVAFR